MCIFMVNYDGMWFFCYGKRLVVLVVLVVLQKVILVCQLFYFNKSVYKNI